MGPPLRILQNYVLQKSTIYTKKRSINDIDRWAFVMKNFGLVDMEFYLTEKQKQKLFHLPKVAALSASSLLMKNNDDCDRLF